MRILDKVGQLGSSSGCQEGGGTAVSPVILYINFEFDGTQADQINMVLPSGVDAGPPGLGKPGTQLAGECCARACVKPTTGDDNSRDSTVGKDRQAVGFGQPGCWKEGDRELVFQYVIASSAFSDQVEEAVRRQGKSIPCADGGTETASIRSLVSPLSNPVAGWRMGARRTRSWLKVVTWVVVLEYHKRYT